MFSADGNFDRLLARLEQLEQAPERGQQIMRHAAQEANRQVRQEFSTQGRAGAAPPLSEMTREIYRQAGQPDGSGILDHLKIEYQQNGDRFLAILGLPAGEPTMIARVQNDGAIIPVTDRMRGFLSASFGIHLRRDTTHIVIPGRGAWDRAIATTNTMVVQQLKNFFSQLPR